MTAIDVHTHAFPDEIAGRAMRKLEGAAGPWKAVGDGTVAGLLASMDAADIEVSLVCTIATKPDQVQGILDWCVKIRDERIIPLPSVHPLTPDAPAWIKRFAECGFAGIKMHPMYQDFAADSPQMDAIYRACVQHDLFVTLHCGKDIAFPEDDDRAAPARLRSAIDRHAGLKLVCTHMGGWRDWDAVQRLLVGTSVYFETSFSLNLMPREQAVSIIKSHDPERILFGSDWPWQRQDETLRMVMDLGLGEPLTSAIFHRNAAKLIGG